MFRPNDEADDESAYIYVAFITLKNGRRIYAANYGLKAFRIRVKERRS